MNVFSSLLAFAIAILSLSLLWTSTHGLNCSPLCPDGTPVPNPDNVLIEDADSGAQFTCGPVVTMIKTPPVINCGCDDTLPPVPGNTSCPICEDMSTPPNPSLDLGVSGTCHSIAWNFLLRGANASWHNPLSPYPSNQTRECLAMQATGGVYCGCSNTVAMLDVCRICGNQLLPEPSRSFQLDNISTSCLEMEFNSNVESEFTCADFQNVASPVCCSNGPPAPTAPMPSLSTPPAPTALSPTPPAPTAFPTTQQAPTALSPTPPAPTALSPTLPDIDPTMPPSRMDTLQPSNASTLSRSASALIMATNLIALLYGPFGLLC